jgi:hypothetical protein
MNGPSRRGPTRLLQRQTPTRAPIGASRAESGRCSSNTRLSGHRPVVNKLPVLDTESARTIPRLQNGGRTLDKRGWPEWWEWELELSPHLLKRMEDRGFNEVDLRSIPERASNYRRDVVEGRWVVESRHMGGR